MTRRRPIPRSAYRWQPKPKPANVLRFELILDGAVRKYPNGREVCQDTFAGRREYLRRLGLMLARQRNRCCLCPDRIYSVADATFEHQRRRGMGAGFRDDRVQDENGKEINGAAHWICKFKERLKFL